MTAPGPAALEGLDGVVRLVLDDDGLDLLELALAGALPADAWRPWPGEAVLTDAENTPLARIDGGTATPLRPFAAPAGAAADPSIRRSAAAAGANGLSDTAVLVADDLPTHDDVLAVADAAAGAAPVTLVLLGSRRSGTGRPDAAALVRAWQAVLPRIAGDVRLLLVPWPAAPAVAPVLGRVLAAYGLAGARRADAARTARTASLLGGLDGALADAAARVAGEVYPDEAVREALRVRDAHARRGAVVFFTGLSGSGKSTIAKALAADLAATSSHRVTLLDGDEVRQHLSKGLGFDAESRATNIARIAWVGALVAGHGGLVLAAPIAPFDAGRKAARAMADAQGAAFILVHVSTPLGVCEARDRKGMYAKARAGEIAEFTGISSPYEAPEDAELVIDAATIPVADAVARVRAVLQAVLAG